MNIKTRLAVLMAASVLLAIVLGVERSPSTQEHQRSDDFWSFNLLNAQEVEGFDTIDEMAASADHVVLGRVVATGLSREYDVTLGNGTADKVWYGRMTVAVEEVYAGQPLDHIDIEVFLPSRPGYQRFLDAAIPADRTLFFIRNKERSALAAGWPAAKAKSEAGYARLVNLSQSYFRELDGRVHVPEPGSGDFTSLLEGKTFSELLSELDQK